jgi:uncharacterized membrane protein YidH (DUF202 family)
MDRSVEKRIEEHEFGFHEIFKSAPRTNAKSTPVLRMLISIFLCGFGILITNPGFLMSAAGNIRQGR